VNEKEKHVPTMGLLPIYPDVHPHTKSIIGIPASIRAKVAALIAVAS